MAKFFKLTPVTAADYEPLMWILMNKTFYPEPTSTPALPAVYDNSFDYRQLLVYVGKDADGNPIVKTRKDYTTGTFATAVIPTADWTTRYRLASAPTITVSTVDDFDSRGLNTFAKPIIFQSYQYMQ